MRKKREEFNEEQQMIANDLDKAIALDVFAQSEGGQQLAKALLADAVSAIESLSAHYKTFTMQEFVGTCAEMKLNLDQYRVLIRANKKRISTQAALDLALKEEIGE